MKDLLEAIQNTPLPTILIVAGIFFWLLAIAGSIAGKITVEPSHQKVAGLVGSAFIVIGVVLFFVHISPNPSPSPATTPSSIPSDGTIKKSDQGCDVTVYWDSNFGGEEWRTQHDSDYVGDHWNDQISSIRVTSGNWEFYWDAHYKGEVLKLGPGAYAYVGDHWNDQISSFRCISPTN